VITLIAATAILATGCNAPDPSAADSGTLPTTQDDLVKRAKTEGTVVLGAGGHTREQAQLLADKFQEKYGIKVTFVRESSGDIAQKVQAQLSAKALQFDVVSLNNEATLQKWSKDNILADPQLANRDQIVGTLDTAGGARYAPFTWAAMGYSYNSAKIKPESAPRTWAELAGRPATFAIADPKSSGAALTFVAAMTKVQPDFLPRVGQGKKLISDSALALTQTIATGEADYGIPGIEADVATARTAGEPLAMGYPDGQIGALLSFVGTLADAPHPAAARLLTQFQLSAEFQALQAGIGSRSVLKDVAAPTGAATLAEDRLVVIKPEELAANKDALLATFDEKVRG
jgi:iron(III) transport system substrate-binding protein